MSDDNRVIYKYPFNGRDILEIESPYPLEFLSIQLQHNDPTVWAYVYRSDDNSERTYTYRLMLIGTGWSFGDTMDQWNYVGTIQTPEGLVWHCFSTLISNPSIVEW